MCIMDKVPLLSIARVCYGPGFVSMSPASSNSNNNKLLLMRKKGSLRVKP